jgi:hypothetical protein
MAVVQFNKYQELLKIPAISSSSLSGMVNADYPAGIFLVTLNDSSTYYND